MEASILNLEFKKRQISKRSEANDQPIYTYYEFFSGGGMARLGLGKRWKCAFANDFSQKKAAAYKENFQCNGEFVLQDVSKLSPTQLQGNADLAWASFPCQDLSLAGQGAGLKGGRSGTFWPFWNLMKSLNIENRAPKIIVLENVLGALTSHNGSDFIAIMRALSKEGYQAGAIVGDAIHFVPQSRPRLFIIAIKNDFTIPQHLLEHGPGSIWHPFIIKRTFLNLPRDLRKTWKWWKLPNPPERSISIEKILELDPLDVKPHDKNETKKLLSMMSPINLKKVKSATNSSSQAIGFIYKRTRTQNGEKIQRAEVRFDGVSGCLRTPAGGSSRQIILIVDGDNITSRLISPRETARLMGVPDEYILPKRYNEAYHLMGDGLVVPVVSWIETYLLHPILSSKVNVQ